MSADREIDGWLSELGFGLPSARQRARAALEEAQLTRAGKTRMSEEKLPRAKALLDARFYLCCEAAACQAKAAQSGREKVVCSPKSACQSCGGSDNQRAEAALIDACRRHNVHRLLVVGGSPAVREELERALGTALELRMVDGTERRTQDKAKHDLDWADLALVWGASELHHKVSTLYTQVAPPIRRKVIHVARRGVAALLEAAIEHLDRGGGSRL